MGPVAKMCLSFLAVAVFAIVSSGIYLTLKGRLGLDDSLGTTPVVILNTLLASVWYVREHPAMPELRGRIDGRRSRVWGQVSEVWAATLDN